MSLVCYHWAYNNFSFAFSSLDKVIVAVRSKLCYFLLVRVQEYHSDDRYVARGLDSRKQGWTVEGLSNLYASWSPECNLNLNLMFNVSHAHSQQLSKPESCPHHLFLMPTRRLMLFLRKSPREIRFSTKASRELEEVGQFSAGTGSTGLSVDVWYDGRTNTLHSTQTTIMDSRLPVTFKLSPCILDCIHSHSIHSGRAKAPNDSYWGTRKHSWHPWPIRLRSFVKWRMAFGRSRGTYCCVYLWY